MDGMGRIKALTENWKRKNWNENEYVILTWGGYIGLENEESNGVTVST